MPKVPPNLHENSGEHSSCSCFYPLPLGPHSCIVSPGLLVTLSTHQEVWAGGSDPKLVPPSRWWQFAHSSPCNTACYTAPVTQDPAPLVSTELSLDPAFYSVRSVQTMHRHKFLGGPWANGIVPVLIASCPATHRKAILQKCRTVKLLSGLGRCNCTREFMASRRGPHSK